MDVARLKAIPLFAEVSDDELATIAPFAEETEAPAGEALVKEGQFAYEFMAIEEGEAEVSRAGEHVAELGAGDFFGEVGVLATELRTATVTARTPMRLITLTGWDMKRLERNIPQAIEHIRRVLEQRRAG
jgi:CRP/FNR family transcriptional regulator, cyclic AMP receptor protein